MHLHHWSCRMSGLRTGLAKITVRCIATTSADTPQSRRHPVCSQGMKRSDNPLYRGHTRLGLNCLSTPQTLQARRYSLCSQVKMLLDKPHYNSRNVPTTPPTLQSCRHLLYTGDKRPFDRPLYRGRNMPSIHGLNVGLSPPAALEAFRPIERPATSDAAMQARLKALLCPTRWVDGAPVWLQPYLRMMRADKPIGTWLLYWPCTWSIALASTGLPDVRLLALFGLGAWLMRGAGCVVNDLWDRDFDRLVERTRNRPLARGDISERQAAVCLLGLLGASFGVLMQLNWPSVFVGAASLGLVVAYPLAKRYTYWPQVVLGLTLNWGILISWTHLTNGDVLGALPLYLGCVLHTIIYDTIYSHQDKTDDLMVGVKSTALRFGASTKPWLTGFATAMVGCLALSGIGAEQTWPFYVGVALTGSHLAWQISTVNIDDPADCWEKFRANQWLGAILFTAIVCGNLLRQKRRRDNDNEASLQPLSEEE